MKITHLLVVALVFLLTPFSALFAGTGASEMQRLASEVSALKLGFGDYVLGSQLTKIQKETAGKNDIKKTLDGTYKFVDGEIYVIAREDDDTVLGIYKNYPEVPREDLKKIIGDLMMRFEEPTTMAHQKIIYWAFNKNGKVSGDVYDFSKTTGDADMIATVKFQSSVDILPDPERKSELGASETAAEEFQKEVNGTNSSVYVIVSSDPMSKLFLAQAKK